MLRQANANNRVVTMVDTQVVRVVKALAVVARRILRSLDSIMGSIPGSSFFVPQPTFGTTGTWNIPCSMPWSCSVRGSLMLRPLYLGGKHEHLRHGFAERFGYSHGVS